MSYGTILDILQAVKSNVPTPDKWIVEEQIDNVVELLKKGYALDDEVLSVLRSAESREDIPLKT